jgi:predicted RecB family nuclease
MKHLGGNTWTFDTRDLMRATTCSHCTAISVLRELQVPQVLEAIRPFLVQPKTLAQKYGDSYEDALVAELKQSLGADLVVEPDLPTTASMADRFAATVALMKQGIPVIYQGGLEDATRVSVFRGKPDFLVHQDWDLGFEDGKLTARKMRETSGEFGYTAWDAKYASSAKPAYALQVGLYISALENAGWKATDARHGVILGDRSFEVFTEAEVVPIMEVARMELDRTIDGYVAMMDAHKVDEFLATFDWGCTRKALCEICEYPDLCDISRHQTDSLLLVHNINGSQVEKLRAAGINSVTQLASTPDEARPQNLEVGIFNRLRAQADAQTLTKNTGQPQSFLMADPLLRFLPPANPGDIYFDMEGFPYYEEKGGLEYLFGNWTPEGVFVDFWAHSREEEGAKFVEFMNWMLERLEKNPGAHVYHYAPYEVSALRRLATRHGVMEQAVTDLEQTGRFVDLAAQVKKSLIIGQESYSIKYLEQYYGFKRTAEVKKAADSVDGYDQWLELKAIADDDTLDAPKRAEAAAEAEQVLADLRKYNMEDVISTKALYDWLAGMEGACSQYGAEPDPKVSNADNNQSASAIALLELQEKTRKLFEPLEGWDWGQDVEADERALAWAALAHSILFYRREDVMYWSDLYLRLEQDDAAMEADRKAELLRNVVVESNDPGRAYKGESTTRLIIQATLDPEGLFRPKEGDDVVMRHSLPGGRTGWTKGEVLEIADGHIRLKRSARSSDEHLLPNAILDYQFFNASNKQAALNQLADRIAAIWADPRVGAPEGFAAIDLLLRRPPRLKGGHALVPINAQSPVEAILNSIMRLDNSVLAIQGPPGAGKTYVASNCIAHLIHSGAKVGVVTNSHKACENLLEACIEVGVDPSRIFKSNKKGETAQFAWNTPKSVDELVKDSQLITDGVLIGGTAWTFSNPAVSAKPFDYIFVDEAAQFSMVDALAVSNGANNLILLGDPQQLPQVVSAIHPGGVENSALGHYMGDNEIIPASHGYFMEYTRRLHPLVNDAVSWLSYDGKLKPFGTQNRTAPGCEPGLTVTPLMHQFNSTSSVEEATAVISRLWNLTGSAGQLTQADILIVSPYNAQVDLIRDLLDQAGFTEVEVGTVDKFQGREAKLVLVSMAASSAEDAPRGVEFLFDRNRLNVAISRAQVSCEIFVSAQLLRAQFRSLKELKALSRFMGLFRFAKVGEL